MKHSNTCVRLAAAVTAAATTLPVAATPQPLLESLVTCRESWNDWQKAGDPRIKTFGEYFQKSFKRKDNEPYFLPNAPTTMGGFRIIQVYPESVGMGVGFSVLVEATFEKAQKVFGPRAGKPLKHCESGEGMRTCDVEIADKRNFTLLSSDKPGDTKTLVGCYYYYEK